MATKVILGRMMVTDEERMLVEPHVWRFDAALGPETPYQKDQWEADLVLQLRFPGCHVAYADEAHMLGGAYRLVRQIKVVAATPEEFYQKLREIPQGERRGISVRFIIRPS